MSKSGNLFCKKVDFQQRSHKDQHTPKHISDTITHNIKDTILKFYLHPKIIINEAAPYNVSITM